jgi:hypothetical protein
MSMIEGFIRINYVQDLNIKTDRTHGGGHRVRGTVVVLYRRHIKTVVTNKCHSSIASFVQAGWIVEGLALLLLFCLVT